MSDVINIQKRFQRLESAETFDGYSKVIVNVSDDVRYISGTDVGRILEVTSPFGSQTVADDILARIRGYQYQPFSASGAILDPAAELGDGISADGLYGGIFAKKVSLGGLYNADLSAPGGEKINYKAPYKSRQDRTIERNYKDLSSKLTVQSGLISAEVEARKSDVDKINAALKVQEGEVSAKVSKTGGDPSSFGWVTDDHSWVASANNSEVFRLDKNGAQVTGTIRATSGKIGGFDIMADYLSYNNMTWGGTNTNGIYFGTQGFQFGRNFKVDNAGYANMSGATVEGTINCKSLIVDGQTISASTVRGGISGGNSYASSGWGNYSAGTVAANASNGNYAMKVLEGTQYMSTINLRSGTFQMNNHNVYLGEIYVEGTNIKVLRWI